MPPETGTIIRAAGAVLWRLHHDAPEVALVHRPRYDDWSLPKGKLDDGEHPLVAAVREVAEETGHRVALGRRLAKARYQVRSALAGRTGPKVVDYWAARSLGGRFQPNAEVDELRWLAPGPARELLSYEFDRAVLDSFAGVPVPTATVLLVRHAKAGDRTHWDGADDLRPLTAAGQRQAAELSRLLAPFAPTTVHSAPRVRCVQSVQPLATSLGVGVAPEPRLSEEGYWPDPATGRRRLLRIAAGTCTPVVCSQGGVIPDLVYALAGPAAADEHGEIPSRKASTWVLSLRGEECLAADYYPPP